MAGDGVTRERPYAGHPCLCHLPSGPCGGHVDNPDQPVCDPCLEHGHPGRPDFRLMAWEAMGHD